MTDTALAGAATDKPARPARAPFGIAWAGESLLVTTLDGDVLRFPDMWSVLNVIR